MLNSTYYFLFQSLLGRLKTAFMEVYIVAVFVVSIPLR